MRHALTSALFAAALGGLFAPAAFAQDLYGPPEPPPPPGMQPPPPGPPPGLEDGPPPPMAHDMDGGREHRHGGPYRMQMPPPPSAGDCYGHMGPGPGGPPPGGPAAGWSHHPGEGGPVWCHKHGMDGPPPGWVKVICVDEYVKGRGRHGKRRVHAHRVAKPAIRTVKRMHRPMPVEHYGYVTRETYRSVETVTPPVPPPPPPCGPCKHPPPWPTTFDTGYITWPGKVRF
jgi:hypothetical protein